MKQRKSLLAAIILLFLVSTSALAQPAAPADASLLTIDRIFGSTEFSGDNFGSARWLKDGSAYTALEPSSVPGGRDIVRYDTQSGQKEVLVAASRLIPAGQKNPLRVEDYDWSADGKLLKIFTNGKRSVRTNTRGDYWVLELESGKLWQVGGKPEPSTLMFAKFSPDGRQIAYVRNNNIYVQDIKSQKIVQLTNDGAPHVINGAFDWVYEEELGVRDGFRWSPDGKFIAYWQVNTEGEPEFQLINNTDDLYPKLKTMQYPKVGQTIAAVRVGAVRVTGGPTRWLNVDGDPRDQYIVRMSWAEKPQEIIIQRLNRRQNQNDLMAGDPLTGKVRTILTERDDAWVELHDDVRFLDSGKSFLWISERDGWNHVYRFPRSGGEPKLITRGDYDVISIQAIDEKGGWIYYMASPDNPTQRYMFRIRLDGEGQPERLSPATQAGVHNYRTSPNGASAFHTYSSFDQPPVTDLVRLPQHETVRVLADNAALRAKVAGLKRVPTEFFRVDNGNGVALDAWMIKPPDMQPGKKYPMLVQVYGEPASQTTLDQWGGATYLWHLMLAQRGYVVVSIDNRGVPAPRGRAWRKAIYKNVGIISSADQAAAVKQITKRPFIDPERVGVWGWSGGGSMTLNAMFRYPDVYSTGMAVASVPDQRLYDAPYEERYMGLLTDEGGEAYKQASPITFAKNLKGNLLVVHGTGDDNVHYQGAERLINELVKENKQFTFMSYPNRTHGIAEGQNTSRHLRYLLTDYLEQHLQPGPK